MKLTHKERLCVRGTARARTPHCVHPRRGILCERGREGESTTYMHVIIIAHWLLPFLERAKRFSFIYASLLIARPIGRQLFHR